MELDDATSTVDRDSARATVHALPPGAHERRAAASANPEVGSAQTSMQFALATLREEEADTARTMIRVGRLIALAAIVVLPFTGGSVNLRIAFACSVAIAIVAGLVIDRQIRAHTFTERGMLVLAYSVAPAIFAGALYFGVFSAVQLFPALALYFFSRRENFRSALALYLTNTIMQLVFGTLIIARAIDDPGLIRPDLPPAVLAIGHALLQMGFVGAFLLGRGSHAASREAILKMQKAMLLAAQREALLHEARADLDKALAIDKAGRFTDHTFGFFRLGHVIGRGGMGEVYEAWHTGTGDIAAVKLLAHRELGNPQSVERFLREVRAVRGLTSQHVVRVLAACDERDEIPYFVMERLRGQDLSHHLRSGRIPPEMIVEMLGQVGDAVEEAWQQGIVHRDLKPQNLFLADGESGPIWKVLDFGVAALEDHSGTLTQGKVVGTPSYMAPEQAKGERVDHRADVYALTAIAYRCLTGRPVCSGKDLHAALYQTVHVMPQRPSALAELHADVDAALAIGLVKNPDHRWMTVMEVRDALAAALAGELSPALRRRGADIINHHPWGAVRG